jgi:Anti-sigma-K factor rskA, C-terminal
VNREPDFDDLVGPEVAGAERERLQRTHELLVTAGRPPELSPELAAGPTLAMTLARRPGPVRRHLALAAAAAVAVGLVFLGGYAAGNGSRSSGVSPVRTLQLHGTAVAPNALASLRLLPADAGNWPMTLTVTGLPAPPKGGDYEVYLVRGGKPWASCGTFVVADPSTATTVTLNAPYRLRASDGWVVTRHAADSSGHGPTVLQQTV